MVVFINAKCQAKREYLYCTPIVLVLVLVVPRPPSPSIIPLRYLGATREKVSEDNKIMGVVTEGNLMACLLNGRVQPEDDVASVMYRQFKKVKQSRQNKAKERKGKQRKGRQKRPKQSQSRIKAESKQSKSKAK